MTDHLNHGADDRLSRAATAMLNLTDGLALAHQEVASFGAPSECYGDVNRGHLRDAEHVLASHGFTVDAFEHEFGRRVTGRCALDLLGAMCLPEGDDEGPAPTVAAVRDHLRDLGYPPADCVEVHEDPWCRDVAAVRATFGRTVETFLWHTDDDLGPELEDVVFTAWPPQVRS